MINPNAVRQGEQPPAGGAEDIKQSKDVTILVGDVREQLKTLADDSIDCVVTSPPYWGLRDYGVEGQLGLEPTLDVHLRVMVVEVSAILLVPKREGIIPVLA